MAYIAFNDGIQTVIIGSSVFLAQELFVARGLPKAIISLVALFVIVMIVLLLTDMERAVHEAASHARGA